MFDYAAINDIVPNAIASALVYICISPFDDRSHRTGVVAALVVWITAYTDNPAGGLKSAGTLRTTPFAAVPGVRVPDTGRMDAGPSGASQSRR